jgi:DNA-binding NarL/FixJ family response regulator
MSISLVVCDDHQVVRLGLRNILASGGIEVVGEATNGEQLVTMLANKLPDVVLLDVRMPGGDGLHYLGRIKINHPTLPVLLFSTYDNPTYVARAVALGASGYVLKSESSEKLIAAIKGALRGELAWTREELRRVTGALATPRVVLKSR